MLPKSGFVFYCFFGGGWGFATNPRPNGFSMLLWDVPCGSGLGNVDIMAKPWIITNG